MSYKVLMGLIVVMFALQTIHNIGNWYITWLGFIYYSDAPDQALDALEVDGVKLALRIIGSMFDLLITMRLAIADSIMVNTWWPLPFNRINSLSLKGLEVLDHMQQELDGSSCPSGLRHCVYRYVLDLRDNELISTFSSWDNIIWS
jgi:hypothetical protein